MWVDLDKEWNSHQRYVVVEMESQVVPGWNFITPVSASPEAVLVLKQPRKEDPVEDGAMHFPTN